MNETIAAVVVTHNRIKLLQECIEALRNQTRKLDEIIVVNNDSQDGTKEWLDELRDLTKIHQENLGGAGGFHNGMKLAYEKGYDWIWTMDDDCLPELNALENLLTTEFKTNVILNSVVIAKTNPQQLNFGLEDYKNKKFFKTISEIKDTNIIYGANFFNGTLIHKDVIIKIGFPNSLFFIYGDEYEYYLRIKNSNIPILTILSSCVRHTAQVHRYIGRGKFFFRLNEFNKLSVKYVPRNLFVICQLFKEYTFRRLIKTYIFDLLGIILIQKRIYLAIYYIISIFNGIFLLKKIKQTEKV
ncbi:MAG: glycosyltransferase [Ignavibacteriae bacterium]|nr:glycosyltransferase [Ignavibacteriota bacterium]